MKQAFIEKRFSRESLALLLHVSEILDDYARQGYDLSLRQCYYQLLSKGLIENSEKSYDRIGALVSDARLAGMLDWDMIKDRGRVASCPKYWSSGKELLETCAKAFRLDHWDGQDEYVEVMVEKQALEGVLEPICRELGVVFSSNKGYTSSSALYETYQRFLPHVCDGKKIHVIYLGDHDPSGLDMSRDVEERLQLFFSYDPPVDEDFLTVHRIALNIDQVHKFKLPENPAKLKDTRAGAYVAKYGYSSWELDAIPPATLARMVTAAVISIRDEETHNNVLDRETEQRRLILEAAKNIK